AGLQCDTAKCSPHLRCKIRSSLATRGRLPAHRWNARHAFVAYFRDVPVFRPKPETGLGQLLRMKQLFHLADITALPTYDDKLREATIKLAGARSLIGVPMIKDDEVIGAIVIYRQEVRPFTD